MWLIWLHFALTSPMSKCLQTSRRDLVGAHRMVTETHQQLWKTPQTILLTGQTQGSRVRNLKWKGRLHCQKKAARKAIPGESGDAARTATERFYGTNVHNVILDTASERLHRWFLQGGTWLNFPLIKANGLPPNALQNMRKCLLKFDEDATVERCQTSSYTGKVSTPWIHSHSLLPQRWRKIKLILVKCALCCYLLLFTPAYHKIGLAYRYLLTLSCTQVYVKEVDQASPEECHRTVWSPHADGGGKRDPTETGLSGLSAWW